MEERFREGGLGYGEVKKDLLRRVLERFGEARARREELERRAGLVEDVLRAGATRARETAAPLMERVRRASGLGPG
jgi:tryptophanyl-tRNA synthetase